MCIRDRRKLVHDFLAREGYEVLEAGDGEEALDIFYQQKDIARLVLDICLLYTSNSCYSSCTFSLPIFESVS